MNPPQAAQPVKDKTRAKYLTAALLVIWVIGVFLFTYFKFSGAVK
jgi:hypothetical protein